EILVAGVLGHLEGSIANIMVIACSGEHISELDCRDSVDDQEVGHDPRYGSSAAPVGCYRRRVPEIAPRGCRRQDAFACRQEALATEPEKHALLLRSRLRGRGPPPISAAAPATPSVDHPAALGETPDPDRVQVSHRLRL